jgi:hypothetical protein
VHEPPPPPPDQGRTPAHPAAAKNAGDGDSAALRVLIVDDNTYSKATGPSLAAPPLRAFKEKFCWAEVPDLEGAMADSGTPSRRSGPGRAGDEPPASSPVAKGGGR